ncbi:MAG TPA: thiamine phosphate synthase [Chloroflexota bacterium]|nr:thiamine phosphate synthase [Chloroflexota bacterium]
MTEPRPCLPVPIVMLVTDRTRCGQRRLEDVIGAAVEGGVNVVQVREKDLSGGELFRLVERVLSVVGTRALVLVNDRLDVALAAGADGVQLGSAALPTEAARQVASRLLLGRSVHDLGCAVEATAEGADLLVVGSIFASPSHPALLPAGPPLLRKIASAVQLPLVGIGGITAANAAQVIGAGSSGVAVISEILDAFDPREATRRLASAVHAAWPTTPLHKRH